MNTTLAKLIIDTVSSGLKSTLGLNRKMNDDPHEKIKPEYLTTVEICRGLALKNEIHFVRMEEETKKVINYSCPPPKEKLDIDRHGKIDIIVYENDFGIERPAVIIEIKNYIDGFSSIKKDILRIKELLLLENKNGYNSLCIGTSAFYWLEDRCITSTDLKLKARKSFSDIERKTNNIITNQSIKITYIFKPLQDNGFASMEEANEEDETGAPASYLNPPYITYSCIIVLDEKG